MTHTEGARELVRAVQTNGPYAGGKLGTSELDTILWYLIHRRSKPDAQKQGYPRHIFQHMVVNAGLFPVNPNALDDWAEYMLTTVLPQMDLMVEWSPSYPQQEHQLLDAYSPRSKRAVIQALEPYYESDPADHYTRHIPEDATIAVIGPFGDTVRAQLPHLADVWSSRDIWDASRTRKFVAIKTYFSPLVASETTGWPDSIRDWRMACDAIVEEVRVSGAKYVLVGCGALSLPIVAALKTRLGCFAIHTGGATQIFFGIKGRRWDTNHNISQFYNSHWIRPVEHEVPTRAVTIEQGCYF
jgi:hypothetical protein